MSLSFEEASELVIRDANTDENCDFVIAHSIEMDYGWFYFLQSKTYLETNDPEFLIIGYGAILVYKNSGAIRKFPSVYSIDTIKQIVEDEIRSSKSV
jgi:Immunity protein 35